MGMGWEYRRQTFSWWMVRKTKAYSIIVMELQLHSTEWRHPFLKRFCCRVLSHLKDKVNWNDQKPIPSR